MSFLLCHVVVLFLLLICVRWVLLFVVSLFAAGSFIVPLLVDLVLFPCLGLVVFVCLLFVFACFGGCAVFFCVSFAFSVCSLFCLLRVVFAFLLICFAFVCCCCV